MSPPSASPAMNEAMPDRWRSVVPGGALAPLQEGEIRPGAAGPTDPNAPLGPMNPTGLPGAPPAVLPNGVIQTAPNEVVIPRTLSVPGAGGASN
jgi:hypothetical protein